MSSPRSLQKARGTGFAKVTPNNYPYHDRYIGEEAIDDLIGDCFSDLSERLKRYVSLCFSIECIDLHNIIIVFTNVTAPSLLSNLYQ